jgi:acyl carrier protein
MAAITIEQQVKDLVVEELGVDLDEVTRDASFTDDLGCDSLDAIELVMAAEMEFDIEIPDDDAEKLTTVGAAIDYLAERVKAKKE